MTKGLFNDAFLLLVTANQAELYRCINAVLVNNYIIAIRLKIQTKSSHKIHRSQLLRPDFVNLNSWIAISGIYIRVYAAVTPQKLFYRTQ